LGGTDNEKAYELYLIAKGHYRTPPLDDRALESINAAIELDPGFTLAWALKSRIHQGLAIHMTGDQVTAALNEGLDAAQRAIELESNLPDGYSALGTIKSNTGKWVEAGSAFRKAFKLKTESSLPSEIFAAPHYECVGYLKKAKENFEDQLLNDPLNANYRSWYL
jgi:tetratricopeptide (TPR) repeat protein